MGSGELAENACRLLRVLQRLCVGEDPPGVDADVDARAEAVARLSGNAPLAQPVQRAVQGSVVLDIELDAPLSGHGQSVPRPARR